MGMRASLLITSVLCASAPAAALADPALDQLQAVERQIQQLKAELRRVKAQEAEQAHRFARVTPPPAPPPAVQPPPVYPQIPAGYALVPTGGGSTVLARVLPPPAPLPPGTFKLGGVTIKLGGYLTGDGVFRTRNNTDDIQSNYTSGIAEPNQPANHEGEFRLSARTSRLTATLSAEPDEVTQLRSYVSIDFQGGAPTSNYNESNSWVPRIREGWAAYDRTDWGVEFLAGQAWSLLTSNHVGTDPLTTNTPITIDPNYVPGFAYARQAQFRVTKSLAGGTYHVAVSLENPATIFGGTTPAIAGTTINTTNPGVGVDATGNSFSQNIAPDVIGKVTADYPIAHLEAYGVGRVISDRVSTLGSGRANNVIGGGAGGAVVVHVIPNYLDAQVSGLAGRGISRYDPSQLPDATIGADGKVEVLPGWEALAGLIGHPTPAFDVYAYIGTDNVSARYGDAGTAKKPVVFGYGNPLFNNSGCDIELSTVCVANTSSVAQATVGTWYKFLHGSYGTMQVGVQYAYTRRFVFQGIGTAPKVDENDISFSFRWYPFQ
jgi:hypothetical protein